MFLGWEPHPMNTNFELAYLTGGDEVFGPNFGGATVYTNVRKGYLAGVPQCRQAPAEPRLHAAHGEQGHGQHPRRRQGAARRPPRRGSRPIRASLDGWLAGVTTFDGGDGLAAVKGQLGS